MKPKKAEHLQHCRQRAVIVRNHTHFLSQITKNPIYIISNLYNNEMKIFLWDFSLRRQKIYNSILKVVVMIQNIMDKQISTEKQQFGFGKRKILTLKASEVVKDLKRYGMLHKSQFLTIIESSISVLKFEPNALQVESPAIVVGDIHGQFHDLVNIFEVNGYPPDQKYIFLGDYVDRGEFSIEVITLLFWLKLKYPKQIYLLRGNHESKILTSMHNFREQCKDKYGNKIYELVITLFEVLPICCIVDKKYFCVHAGISPQLLFIDQVMKINRFSEIPTSGMLCDMLWSDPVDEDRKQWHFNTTRSCSFFYTKTHVEAFLKNNNLQTIIRGHEVQLKGFRLQQICKKEKKNLITIFSAPNYCKKYNNLGAVALIGEEVKIKIYKYTQEPATILKFDLIGWSFKKIFQRTGQLFIDLMRAEIKKGKIKYRDSGSVSVEQQLEKLNSMLMSDKDEVITCSENLSFEQDQQEESQKDEDQLLNSAEVNILTILSFLVSMKRDSQFQKMPAMSPQFRKSVFDNLRNSITLGEDNKQNPSFFGVQSEKCMKQSEKLSFGPKIHEFQKVNFKRHKFGKM